LKKGATPAAREPAKSKTLRTRTCGTSEAVEGAVYLNILTGAWEQALIINNPLMLIVNNEYFTEQKDVHISLLAGAWISA
jgi:hypothetical protein